MDFNLNLPQALDEKLYPEETKIKIREIVGLIINKVKGGNLLLQHNIEYGFVRNLMGGSVVACIVSILNIILFKFVFMNKIVFVTSILTLLIYLMPIIFSKKILKHYADEYADKLFREYLGLE